MNKKSISLIFIAKPFSKTRYKKSFSMRATTSSYFAYAQKVYQWYLLGTFQISCCMHTKLCNRNTTMWYIISICDTCWCCLSTDTEYHQMPLFFFSISSYISWRLTTFINQWCNSVMLWTLTFIYLYLCVWCTTSTIVVIWFIIIFCRYIRDIASTGCCSVNCVLILCQTLFWTQLRK